MGLMGMHIVSGLNQSPLNKVFAMTHFRKISAVLLIALIISSNPIKVLASSDDVSIEIINGGDWECIDNTRPEQEFSDIFRSTVPFKPRNVTAKANRNSITVEADCNTAVRHIIVEYAYDPTDFWRCESKQFRNTAYKKPVVVTRKSAQKFNWKTRKYSSSTDLKFTQGKSVLYSRSIYHPRDKNGCIEANQQLVNLVRKKISFRRKFQIQNIWDCNGTYYVRVIYIYTSALNGKNIRAVSRIVRVR